MYFKPTEVLSPKGQVEVLDVLYDSGEWGVSVARIRYRDELNQQFKECTGMRWNGNLDEDNKGMPVSRGYPIWFVIPDEFSECIQATALALNTDNVPAVIAEIKIEVERERNANPRSYMLEYKTERELSETEVDIILNELKCFGIMEAFMGGTHSVDINGVHSLTLMFPAKGN